MRKQVWNPYLAGALAGVLLVLSVLIDGHFLGASTTFARNASGINHWIVVAALTLLLFHCLREKIFRNQTFPKSYL